MPKWMYRVTCLVNTLADDIVFQSEYVRQMYSGRIRRHGHVIPNPINLDVKAASERKHRIVTMGRLNFQKNHRLLIRSFGRFHTDFPDYTLSVYGDGELKDELSALIADLGLQKYVFLEGNRVDVHECIRDAEMFVLSSDFEGLSNALLESMTMGIACISTACEGSMDVIHNGKNGLLVPIGDEEKLAEAMCMLAGDPAFREKLESQAAADAAVFSVKAVTEQWTGFIGV